MKIALVGPGIKPIPSWDDWYSVENILMDYGIEFQEQGQEGTIINSPDHDEIIEYLNKQPFDFVHVHHDQVYTLMDRIASETNIPKLALTVHSPHVRQRSFKWIVNNKDYYVFCNSQKDYDLFKNAGADESKLIFAGRGVRYNLFSFDTQSRFKGRSVYFSQNNMRNKEKIYTTIPSLEYVIMGETRVDPFYDLGIWDADYKREYLTGYENLVLLFCDEEGIPMVIKEAFIAGLGIVISQDIALDLPDLPFVTRIPDDKLEDVGYIEKRIKENREISLGMKLEIHKFAMDNFSWQVLVKSYLQNIEKLESNLTK